MVKTVTKNIDAKKRKVPYGTAHVSAGFNNTIITITDMHGDALISMSTGHFNFKGAKKSTPYAAQVVAENIATYAIQKYALKTVSVKITGPGPGRESSVRGLSKSLIVTTIKDITPLSHNGCRAKKKRRN